MQQCNDPMELESPGSTDSSHAIAHSDHVDSTLEIVGSQRV